MHGNGSNVEDFIFIKTRCLIHLCKRFSDRVFGTKGIPSPSQFAMKLGGFVKSVS